MPDWHYRAPSYTPSVPLFARAGAGTWIVPSESINYQVPGASFHAQKRWWSQRWVLFGQSRSPWPEPMVLYIARDRIEHGYWRDVLVGEPAFDARYFIYCDTPALAPLIVGQATRAAIDASFDARSPRTLTLHVTREIAETESIVERDDPDATHRHAEVHRGLAADARAVTESWALLADALGGRLTRAWPPALTLLRPIGDVVIEMRWQRTHGSSASEWAVAEASLVTKLTALDAHPGAPGWQLVAVPMRTPDSIAIGPRWVEPRGAAPDLGAVAPALVGAGVASVTYEPREVSLSLAGLASAGRVTEALALLDRLVDPTQRASPYR